MYSCEQLSSDQGLPLPVRLLNKCHHLLIQGARGGNKRPSEVRQSRVWLGGTRPGSAAFLPPPANELASLLSELEKDLHGPDTLAPLLRIGTAHVQVETIHPYLDANGRLGRMLIALLLAA